jgi:hypothetical protein
MLLYIFAAVSLTFITLARCALYPNIGIAGNRPPNSPVPVKISINRVKDVQLIQFLKNLKVLFFFTTSINLLNWDTEGYFNSTLDTVNRITAIS